MRQRCFDMHSQEGKRIRDKCEKAGIFVILAEVGETYGLSWEEICGSSKVRPRPAARHLLWQWLYDQRDWSPTKIAEFFEIKSAANVRRYVIGDRRL